MSTADIVTLTSTGIATVAAAASIYYAVVAHRASQRAQRNRRGQR